MSHQIKSIPKIKQENWDTTMVVLHPLTMRIFNRYGIYSPSKLRDKKEIPYKEFVKSLAEHPINMRVCFDDNPDPDTLLERSEEVTAYGYGLSCLYSIIEIK